MATDEKIKTKSTEMEDDDDRKREAERLKRRHIGKQTAIEMGDRD